MKQHVSPDRRRSVNGIQGASYPKNRTLEMFREWFEVQMSSIVEDLYLGEALEYLQ